MALLLLFFTPVVLSLSTLLGVYMGSDVLAVAVFPLYALISGYLVSRFFSEYGSLKVVIGGAVGSTVFAWVVGVQKVIVVSLRELSRSTSSMGKGVGGIIGGTETIVNPDLLFIAVFVSFNAPLVYSLYRGKALEPRHLLLYLVPVVVYLAVPLLFNGALS